jgi:hypothetical protein
MIMIKSSWILPLTLFAVVGFSGIAGAKLIKIGTATMKGAPSSADSSHPGSAIGSSELAKTADSSEYSLIYEDDTGLIWLDYTNMGQSWYSQVQWAAGLNDPGVLTYNLEPGISVSWEGEWRLPTTVDGARRFGYDGTTTAGFNICIISHWEIWDIMIPQAVKVRAGILIPNGVRKTEFLLLIFRTTCTGRELSIHSIRSLHGFLTLPSVNRPITR